MQRCASAGAAGGGGGEDSAETIPGHSGLAIRGFSSVEFETPGAEVQQLAGPQNRVCMIQFDLDCDGHSARIWHHTNHGSHAKPAQGAVCSSNSSRGD